MERMSSGQEGQWLNPYAEGKAETNATFDERKEMVRPGAERIIKDAELVRDIEESGYPTDEDSCKDIAERHGVDEAVVAVISEELLKREKGDSVH